MSITRNPQQFFQLTGHTIRSVRMGLEEVVITTEYGEAKLFHSQCCCENVRVETVVGDPSKLVGEKIEAACDDGSAPPDWSGDEDLGESFTWTRFRLLAGNGACVDIYWLGTSNGYYSESVDFAWAPTSEAA